ncbi:MAG: WGR domain-containing protein, partial [Candidatus Latescibacteria bacterium]|nr:WGR domain-containing protein [Candidatus Latescibacterota bacterium]
MSPEPIYLRFENTSPPHRKFYEVEVELSLFYPKRLVRRWGRIGARKPR